MSGSTWRLQDAKNQFSKVVEAALHGEPQHVTRRGREVVVVLAAEVYDRLEKNQAVAPPGFVDHLLMMPKDDGDFERLPFQVREVDF
jgi:antitoxin Phd